MTLENCKLYLEQATTEEDKTFWEERIARKYGDVQDTVEETIVDEPVEEPEEEVEPVEVKPKKGKK